MIGGMFLEWFGGFESRLTVEELRPGRIYTLRPLIVDSTLTQQTVPIGGSAAKTGVGVIRC